MPRTRFRELMPDGHHPCLNRYDPFVTVTLGLIQIAHPCGGQFRVFNFFEPFVTHLGQPAFEGFGIGRGDGLDDAEQSFRIGTLRLSAFAIWSQ